MTPNDASQPPEDRPPRATRRKRAKKARRPFTWPSSVPAAELADLAELSVRRIRDLAAAGHFPPSTRGKYDFGTVIRGLLAYYRGTWRERQPISDARLARIRAETRRTELEVRKLEGKAVDIKVMVEVLLKIAAGIKGQLYQGLEKEMPVRAQVDAETAARLTVIGRELADEMIEKMGGSLRQWIEAPDPKPEAPAGGTGRPLTTG